MADLYYQKLQKLSQEIGEKVFEKMSSLEMKCGDISTLLHKKFSLSLNSTNSFVSEIRTGNLMRYAFNNGAYARNFRRAGAVLYLLNFSEDDPLITEIRTVYPDFIYPPLKELRAELPTTPSLEESISQLRESDYKWIQRVVNNVISGYNKEK